LIIKLVCFQNASVNQSAAASRQRKRKATDAALDRQVAASCVTPMTCRQGARWTEEDRDLLVNLLDVGASGEASAESLLILSYLDVEVGQELCRSPDAVRMHINALMKRVSRAKVKYAFGQLIPPHEYRPLERPRPRHRRTNAEIGTSCLTLHLIFPVDSTGQGDALLRSLSNLVWELRSSACWRRCGNSDRYL
jgi:hypothetical protein